MLLGVLGRLQIIEDEQKKINEKQSEAEKIISSSSSNNNKGIKADYAEEIKKAEPIPILQPASISASAPNPNPIPNYIPNPIPPVAKDAAAHPKKEAKKPYCPKPPARVNQNPVLHGPMHLAEEILKMHNKDGSDSSKKSGKEVNPVCQQQ